MRLGEQQRQLPCPWQERPLFWQSEIALPPDAIWLHQFPSIHCNLQAEGMCLYILLFAKGENVKMFAKGEKMSKCLQRERMSKCLQRRDYQNVCKGETIKMFAKGENVNMFAKGENVKINSWFLMPSQPWWLYQGEERMSKCLQRERMTKWTTLQTDDRIRNRGLPTSSPTFIMQII